MNIGYIQTIIDHTNCYGTTSHYAYFVEHKSNKIIIQAHNIFIKKFGQPSIHAEHLALLKLLRMKNKPKIFDLIVIRLSQNKILGNSKPCVHCLLRLRDSGIDIRNIYYSVDENTICCEHIKNMKTVHISCGNRHKR